MNIKHIQYNICNISATIYGRIIKIKQEHSFEKCVSFLTMCSSIRYHSIRYLLLETDE